MTKGFNTHIILTELKKYGLTISTLLISGSRTTINFNSIRFIIPCIFFNAFNLLVLFALIKKNEQWSFKLKKWFNNSNNTTDLYKRDPIYRMFHQNLSRPWSPSVRLNSIVLPAKTIKQKNRQIPLIFNLINSLTFRLFFTVYYLVKAVFSGENVRIFFFTKKKKNLRNMINARNNLIQKFKFCNKCYLNLSLKMQKFL